MDALNRQLMTFASYDAGPGRLRQIRHEAQKRGLDHNVYCLLTEQAHQRDVAKAGIR